MVGETDARLDARMDRMESMIREIERQQHGIQVGQSSFKWASGIIAAFVIAVIAGLVGIDLTRIFALGDRVAAVDKQTGQIAVSMSHLEEDVARMAGSLEAVRADVERIAAAVAPGESGKKAELPR